MGGWRIALVGCRKPRATWSSLNMSFIFSVSFYFCQEVCFMLTAGGVELSYSWETRFKETHMSQHAGVNVFHFYVLRSAVHRMHTTGVQNAAQQCIFAWSSAESNAQAHMCTQAPPQISPYSQLLLSSQYILQLQLWRCQKTDWLKECFLPVPLAVLSRLAC